MHIRAAVPDDLPAIGRLAAMLVALHHELDRQRFIAPTPRTPEGYTSFLGTHLGEGDTLVLVAEEEGAIVGHATMAELKRRGAPRFVLWTAALNASAQAMFASAGFRATMLEMTRELESE